MAIYAVSFFTGAVFSCLWNIIIFPVYVEGPFHPTHEEYSMALKKVAEWMDSEACLIKIAFWLGQKFLVRPALSLVLPSLLGFQQTSRTHCFALFCFTTSHDWFMVWMAFLSFTRLQIDYENTTEKDYNTDYKKDYKKILQEDCLDFTRTLFGLC